MKSFAYLILMTALIGSFVARAPQARKLLIVLFPGGAKPQASLKDLFDYSLNNSSSEFSYEYHIIVYKPDLPLWLNTPHSHFRLYTYGQGDEGFIDFDSYSGVSFITHYTKWLREFSRLFLSSGIMKALREEQAKGPFDLIATDIPNYVSVLLQQELSISFKLYLSPRPFPQLFSQLFELNSNYVPAIGSVSSDKMSFIERFNNFFSFMRDRYVHFRMKREQATLYKQFNYTLQSDVFMRDAVNIIQYPRGVVFPMSTPPNFIFLNAIGIKQGRALNNIEANAFIERYRDIIYIAEDAFELLQASRLIDIATTSHIGFVIQSNRTKGQQADAPLFHTSIEANDIIAHEATKCVIAQGDFTMITQSIYHFKPMILLSKGLMQNNIVSFAVHKQIALKIEATDTSKDNLLKSIATVCLNGSPSNPFKSNVKGIGLILRSNKDAKKEYSYWLDYVLKYSYNTLIVPLYLKGNWLSINCLDVLLFIVAIIISIILLLRFITNSMFGTCKKDKKRIKHKID